MHHFIINAAKSPKTYTKFSFLQREASFHVLCIFIKISETTNFFKFRHMQLINNYIRKISISKFGFREFSLQHD